MDTTDKILNLNNSFYIQVADSFNQTRQILWQGWSKLFAYFDKTSFYPESFLDLGCGNGRFVENIKAVNKGKFLYLGIDNNKFLIREANTKYKSEYVKFKLDDIFNELKTHKKFDLITLFGVFHHMPSVEMRIKLLGALKRYLNPNGKIIFTTWNFKDRKLFTNRLKPRDIEILGIDPKTLDKQDFFLRWSDNSKAVRFCHYYSKTEIKTVLKATGLKIEYCFNADGGNKKTNTYYIICPV